MMDAAAKLVFGVIMQSVTGILHEYRQKKDTKQ